MHLIAWGPLVAPGGWGDEELKVSAAHYWDVLHVLQPVLQLCPVHNGCLILVSLTDDESRPTYRAAGGSDGEVYSQEDACSRCDGFLRLVYVRQVQQSGNIWSGGRRRRYRGGRWCSGVLINIIPHVWWYNTQGLDSSSNIYQKLHSKLILLLQLFLLCEIFIKLCYIV